MNFDPLQLIQNLLESWNLSPFMASTISRTALTVAVFFLAWLVWWLTVKVVYRIVEKIVRRTKATWDDELLKRKFFYRLAWLVPALIIRIAISIFFDESWMLAGFFAQLADVTIVVSITLAIIDLLSFGLSLYDRRQDSKRRPIKGIVQALQVLVITAGFIIVFSDLSGKSVSGLLAGLGALSAVSMIIFQEPLKGLVSGFQISSNDMLRIGDWIEMPSQGADGDVMDISLLNVTVRNWDKTYVTFPIQSLTTGAFKNWRGMSDSGGRRIKRSLHIDMSTIRFLREDEIEGLKSISILRDYLEHRGKEIETWNEVRGENRQVSAVNGRALTNIGVFRAYAKAYVATHPDANHGMTLMVRQLQSRSDGLPIEIYMFSSDKVWANYENIQSDIFDHLLAILSEFGLKVFQSPSGDDIRMLNVSG